MSTPPNSSVENDLRQVGIQQGRSSLRAQSDLAQAGREQRGSAPRQRGVGRVSLDPHRPLQDRNDVAAPVASGRQRGVELPTVQPELRTFDQPAHRRPLGGPRPLGRHRSLPKVDGLQGLVDVQGPRLSVRPQAVPIEQPEGGVARLLDFRHQHAPAEGVDRSGGQEDAIARRWPEGVQAVLAASLANRRHECVAIDARLQSRVDQALRLRLQDDPGLGFPQIGWAQLRGHRIIGMHLDRQRLGRIEELQQQGEAWLGVMPAQQLAAMLADELPQRGPGQRPELHDALVGPMVANLPAFGPVVAGPKVLAERGFQFSAPPNILPQNGAKTKRIERCRGQSGPPLR